MNIETSFKIDYKMNKSELCDLGFKYDTDKSSQRININSNRYCHAYTLFYNSLFKNKRYDSLEIAELGIGNSILMWREYFKNSTIYGFDNDDDYLDIFEKENDNTNIVLSKMDIKSESNIFNSFEKLNTMYDLIIDDTTNKFEDQIRIIKNSYQYLKPGGMLIIEDINKSYDENDYIEKLKDVLSNFKNYYFVTIEHKNRYSHNCDNDKLFVLVKNGHSIFNNNKKITIITPSCRPQNLLKVRESINFEYVDEWIIVYDGSKVTENPNLFINENNDKIKEYIYKGEGTSGNPQRNYALDKISNKETYLYYLDDDNKMNSRLYNLIDIIDDNKLYTFNQHNRINGDVIELYRIDTAMLLIDFNLCKDIRWILDKYNADGYYIKECYEKNRDKWIYVNNTLCYYNYI